MPHSSPRPFEQSLLRAIDLEDDHIGHFRTWALRLRPFDLSLARILDLQADEMDEHKRMLLDCSKPLTHPLRSRNASVHQRPAGAEHFFVLNETGATTILHKARALKEEARNFYLQCTQTETGSARLIRVYQTLQNLKDSHVQILLEAQEGFAAKHHRTLAATHQRFPKAMCKPDRRWPDRSLSC